MFQPYITSYSETTADIKKKKINPSIKLCQEDKYTTKIIMSDLEGKSCRIFM